MEHKPSQPNPLLDGFVPQLSAWSLVTAASVGIFDSLAEGPKGSEDNASGLDLDVPGTKCLLVVLFRLGYVVKEKEQFRLSGAARLLANSTHPGRANWIRFCRTQLLAMSRLQANLEGGPAVDLFGPMDGREDHRMHQVAMTKTALD
jgi:hypothetical protein